MIDWKRLIFGKCSCFMKRKESCELESEREEAIKQAKEARLEAEQKIDNMIAQINGCGDRWFLQPMQTLDECDGNEINGG